MTRPALAAWGLRGVDRGAGDNPADDAFGADAIRIIEDKIVPELRGFDPEVCEAFGDLDGAKFEREQGAART